MATAKACQRTQQGDWNIGLNVDNKTLLQIEETPHMETQQMETLAISI